MRHETFEEDRAPRTTNPRRSPGWRVRQTGTGLSGALCPGEQKHDVAARPQRNNARWQSSSRTVSATSRNDVPNLRACATQVVGADVVLERPQVTVEPFVVPREARAARREREAEDVTRRDISSSPCRSRERTTTSARPRATPAAAGVTPMRARAGPSVYHRTARLEERAVWSHARERGVVRAG